MTSLTVFQCPSDGYNPQPCILYDSTFTNPIATVAHSNYAAVCGWEECFVNATGNPTPFYLNTSDPNDQDGDPTDGIAGSGITCGFGQAGIGMFWRNSNTRIAAVTDGLSNTLAVGERCTAHSPTTWVGAVTGARCPAWMATTRLDNPQYSSLPVPEYRKWHRLRQCGLRRSLVPRPRQRHAQAQQRQPGLRPRCVLEPCTQVDAISCSATARCISSRPA